MFVVTKVKQLLHRSPLFVSKEQIKAAQSKKIPKKKRKHAEFNLKVGQGGTLDPLASGVLVIGVGRGTKQLGQFLECDKVSGPATSFIAKLQVIY
jgi:tRNA pseudouridine55 synthase